MMRCLLSWAGRQFQGSAREFQELIGKTLNVNGSLKEEYFGQPGYLRFAEDHYDDNMQKAFINVSSVLDDEVFVKLGWQAFQGSTREFQDLVGKILNALLRRSILDSRAILNSQKIITATICKKPL